MFLLLPWKVDVPQDRWPVMNWLILLALVAVFALQIRDRIRYESEQNSRPRQVPPGLSRPAPAVTPSEPGPKALSEVPGITRDLMLYRQNLKGLFGYMWLHADPIHLLGNVLFLWIFGNALCAKIGNLKYLGSYVLFGVLAGIVQVLCDPHPSLGASGAINGVVGAYLVLFFENEITCLFLFWPLLFFYIRWFVVSGVWMILLWLGWDIVGALRGGSGVGHFAHLGGFAAGFAIALLMCKKGWITMERYERSLLQAWQERVHGRQQETLDATYAQLGLHLTDEERQHEMSSPAQLPEPEPIPLPALEPGPAPGTPLARAAPSEKPIGRWAVPGNVSFIRTACRCGHALRVTQQYAGRTVRCPNCHEHLVIPPRTDFFGPAPQPAHGSAILKRAHDNAIRFLCTCGRRIKVPAPYAGRTCRCPQCGTTLRIPTVPS